MLGLLLVASLLACSTAAPDSEGTSFLFVQQAASGMLATAGEGYRLTLVGASSTSFFTDRPQRTSGQQSTASFVAGWNIGANSFGADSPNGALVFDTGEGEVTLPLTLSEPNYDASTATLTYDATRLDALPDHAAAPLHQGDLPMNVEEPALFIDNQSAAFRSVSIVITNEAGDDLWNEGLSLTGGTWSGSISEGETELGVDPALPMEFTIGTRSSTYGEGSGGSITLGSDSGAMVTITWSQSWDASDAPTINFDPQGFGVFAEPIVETASGHYRQTWCLTPDSDEV